MQTLLDMSCGSGLFSRRFVKSRKFAGVIAADYSANMLKQTRQFFSEQADCDPRCAARVLMQSTASQRRQTSLCCRHCTRALCFWRSYVH